MLSGVQSTSEASNIEHTPVELDYTPPTPPQFRKNWNSFDFVVPEFSWTGNRISQALGSLAVTIFFFAAFVLDTNLHWETASWLLICAAPLIALTVVLYHFDTKIYGNEERRIVIVMGVLIGLLMGGYLFYLSWEYRAAARDPVVKFSKTYIDPKHLGEPLMLFVSLEFRPFYADEDGNQIPLLVDDILGNIHSMIDPEKAFMIMGNPRQMPVQVLLPTNMDNKMCLPKGDENDPHQQYRIYYACDELPLGTEITELRSLVSYEIEPGMFVGENALKVEAFKQEMVWYFTLQFHLSEEVGNFFQGHSFIQDFLMSFGNQHYNPVINVHLGDMTGADDHIISSVDITQIISLDGETHFSWNPTINSVAMMNTYNIQYDYNQPRPYPKNWRNHTFTLAVHVDGNDEGYIAVNKNVEDIIFTFNDAFTGFLAASGPLLGLLALCFPATLPKRYYIASKNRPLASTPRVIQKHDIEGPVME